MALSEKLPRPKPLRPTGVKLAPAPFSKPKLSQLTAAQAKGIRYERAVVGWLNAFAPTEAGVWLYYETDAPHYAQIDALIQRPDHVRIYEAKLTSGCRDAHDQLAFYEQLAAALWRKPVQLIHVYKWTGDNGRGRGSRYSGAYAAREPARDCGSSLPAGATILGASAAAVELRADEVIDWHFML